MIEFGTVNTENFQNLQNIASVVQHSEGVSLILCRRLILEDTDYCIFFLNNVSNETADGFRFEFFSFTFIVRFSFDRGNSSICVITVLFFIVS